MSSCTPLQWVDHCISTPMRGHIKCGICDSLVLPVWDDLDGESDLVSIETRISSELAVIHTLLKHPREASSAFENVEAKLHEKLAWFADLGWPREMVTQAATTQLFERVVDDGEG